MKDRSPFNSTSDPLSNSAPAHRDSALKIIQRRRVYGFTIVGILLVLCACALYVLGITDEHMFTGVWENSSRLLGEFFPADFSRIGYWWRPAVDTVAMAVAGTMLAVICALPISLVASRASTPAYIIGYIFRSGLHLLRSIPDFIWLIFLSVSFGAGPFAGMLALCLHSIGVLGKAFSEHIEHAAPEPIMAIRSTGAHSIQVISHGILPQVYAHFCDLTLYRFEVNIRTAVILGFIGAGGIGQDLLSSLRILAYQEVAAQLLLLIIVVGIIDALTYIVRKKMLRR